ncbi:MAG: hypothetical protein ACK5HT_02945, partial [Draconibacterium sp.]
DGPVLNSSLEVLKKQKLSGKQLKEFVLPLLNTDNNYVSLLIFNFIQQQGKHKLLKNYELPYRNLAL